MFYVFNANGTFQSAYMVMRDAHNECFNHVGFYYVTKNDANNTENDQIKAYEKRCKQEAEKAVERRVFINEHYGMLNIRFGVRERELLAMGFKRVSIAEYNIAVYVVTKFGKKHTITACAVSRSDEIVWAETIADAKRFIV